MNKELAKVFYAEIGEISIKECIKSLKDRRRKFELDVKYIELEMEHLVKCFHGVAYLLKGKKKQDIPYGEMSVIQNQLKKLGHDKNAVLVSHKHNLAYLDIIIKELEELKEQKNNEERSTKTC